MRFKTLKFSTALVAISLLTSGAAFADGLPSQLTPVDSNAPVAVKVTPAPALKSDLQPALKPDAVQPVLQPALKPAPVLQKTDENPADIQVPASAYNQPIQAPVPKSVIQNASADTWANLVKAPPQGKESFQTKQQAIQALVAARRAGAISSLPPIAGTDGTILYPYGSSFPTVVASPNNVTIIELAPGDKPSTVVIGAPGEWRTSQAMAGNTPILTVTPLFAGLHTNLTITATSADGQPRIYYMTLVSDSSVFVPKVGFYYPQQVESAWQNQQDSTANGTVATLPSLNASDMDFNWSIHCGGGGWFSSSDCSSIRPTRVFDDGVHTYIQELSNEATGGGLPTIMAFNAAGQPALVNFRVKDGYYVLDNVPSEIKLVAGVGSDARIVVIKRESN